MSDDLPHEVPMPGRGEWCSACRRVGRYTGDLPIAWLIDNLATGSELVIRRTDEDMLAYAIFNRTRVAIKPPDVGE